MGIEKDKIVKKPTPPNTRILNESKIIKAETKAFRSKDIAESQSIILNMGIEKDKIVKKPTPPNTRILNESKIIKAETKTFR